MIEKIIILKDKTASERPLKKTGDGFSDSLKKSELETKYPEARDETRKALGKYVLPDSIPFGEKITLLCGGNGVGKTTFINSFVGHRDCFKIIGDGTKFDCYCYRNSRDNFLLHDNARDGDDFDMLSFAMTMNAKAYGMSEGEASVFSSLSVVMDGLLKEIDKPSLIFLDEVDSGLSIDKCDAFCDSVKKSLSENAKVQVVIAFNSYEFYDRMRDFVGPEGKWLKVVSMYDGSEVSFASYGEYAEWIRANQLKFCSNRGKSRDDY
jgi:predicted ATPase